jgi:hypothetical protein
MLSVIWRPSVITVVVALPSMLTSLVALPMSIFAILQEGSDFELLTVDDVHRLIGVVQVVPAWRLMRRITCPHIAESIRMLSLGTVDSAIRPRTGSDVGALGVLEFVHCCSDDGLRANSLVERLG